MAIDLEHYKKLVEVYHGEPMGHVGEQLIAEIERLRADVRRKHKAILALAAERQRVMEDFRDVGKQYASIIARSDEGHYFDIASGAPKGGGDDV